MTRCFCASRKRSTSSRVVGARATFAWQLRQLVSRWEHRRNRLGECDDLYCLVERGCLLAVSLGEFPDLGQRSAHRSPTLSATGARVPATRHFRYWHKCEVPTGSEIVCLSG